MIWQTTVVLPFLFAPVAYGGLIDSTVTNTVVPLVTKFPGYTLSAAACKEIANTNNGGFERVAVREITDVRTAASFLAEYGLFDARFREAVHKALVAQAKKPDGQTGDTVKGNSKIRRILTSLEENGDLVTFQAIESYRDELRMNQRIRAEHFTDDAESARNIAVQAQLADAQLQLLTAALKEQPQSKVAETLRSFVGISVARILYRATSDTGSIRFTKDKNRENGCEISYRQFLKWKNPLAKGVSIACGIMTLGIGAYAPLETDANTIDALIRFGWVYGVQAVFASAATISGIIGFGPHLQAQRKSNPSISFSTELLSLLGLEFSKFDDHKTRDALLSVSQEPRAAQSLSTLTTSSSLSGHSLRDISYLGHLEKGLMVSLREGVELSIAESKAKIKKWDQAAMRVLDSSYADGTAFLDLHESMREFVGTFNNDSEVIHGLKKLEKIVRDSTKSIRKIKEIPFQNRPYSDDPNEKVMQRFLIHTSQLSLVTIEEFGQYAETIRLGRTRYIAAANRIDLILKSKTLSSDTPLSEWHEIAVDFREQLEMVLR